MEQTFTVERVDSLEVRRYRVALFGLGPIGIGAGRMAVSDPRLEVVGAIDMDPAKAGKDLGEVLGLGKKLGVTVKAEMASLHDSRPEAVIHCTGSHLGNIHDQLVRLVKMDLNVISSSEELFYPFLHGPGYHFEIDAAARTHGVTVLGAGVNPGFVMDLLPSILATVSWDVRHIRVERTVDVSKRREPLQRKVGLTMDPAHFRQLADEGKIGHVGLAHSLAFLSATVGFKIDRIHRTLEPLVAERAIHTGILEVKPGQVAGLHEMCRGYEGSELRVELELKMEADAAAAGDRIFVKGDPDLHLHLEGGAPGDRCTPASLINLVGRVIEAEPGLRTLAEIPLAPGGRGAALTAK